MSRRNRDFALWARGSAPEGATVNWIQESLSEMVFCYQYCSDLLWEKKNSSDREKLLKSEAEGREFAKCLRSLEQFIQTVKGQNNFW